MKILSFYLIGRLFALSLKPLTIYIAIKLGTNEESQLLAFIVTLSISIQLLAGFEVHFDYYKTFFSNELKNKFTLAKIFKDYVEIFNRAAFYASLVGGIVIFSYTKDLYTSTLFFFLMFLDLVLHEFHRFIFFQGRLNLWTTFQILRYGIPCLSIYLFSNEISLNMTQIYIISSLVSNVLALVWVLNNSKMLKALDISKKTFKKLSPARYLNDYLTRIKWVAASFLSGHILIIDRYIILAIDSTIFSLYILIANILAGIPTIMDSIYMAKNRKRYPKEKINYKEIFLDLDYSKSILLGFFSALTLVLVLLTYEEKEIYLYLSSLLVLCSYSIYTMSAPFLEIMFWHLDKIERIKMESTFILLCALIGFIIFKLSYAPIIFLIGVLILHTIRTFYLVKKTDRN